MQAILSYIISVINSLVDLLSIQLFPDFPVTVFQFLCSVVVITYIFRFIFGGTREFDNFANLSIRDVSRAMSNEARKQDILERQNLYNDRMRYLKVSSNPIWMNRYAKTSAPVPDWFNNDIRAEKVSPEEQAELREMLREFQ